MGALRRFCECAAARHGSLLGGRNDEHHVALDPHDLAERQAAVAREPAFDEGLVIGAAEEPGGDAAAVGDVQCGGIERHLDGELGRGLTDGERHGAAVLRDRRGDVARALEPALDLQRRDADLGECGYRIEADEILGREEILDLAEIADVTIDDERVGQAAGLRALPAIRRATAPRLAR